MLGQMHVSLSPAAQSTLQNVIVAEKASITDIITALNSNPVPPWAIGLVAFQPEIGIFLRVVAAVNSILPG